MSPRSRGNRQWVRAGIAVLVLLLACLGFVFYFMHAVYEAEETVPEDQVPLAVREGLAARFPGLEDVEWKIDAYYEAGFTWEGKADTEAYFEADGRWVQSEFPIDVDGLPESARALLDAQDTHRVVDVERIESATEAVRFQVELKNFFSEYDVVFNEDGKEISRIRDGPVIEPGVDSDEDDKAGTTKSDSS